MSIAATQAEKAKAFRALHEREGAFVIPNPWDVGTARLLALAGFEALATTSAGYAFSAGVPDFGLSREAMLTHVAEIASATGLPVSGDLENGFGDAPEVVAETIRLAAAAGLVGGSIEDATGRDDDPIYGVEAACDRMRAAADAARSLSFAFTLTGRAENFLHGRRDLKDTIKRLQGYQNAGADVLYAPGLTSGEEIATVVRDVDRPLNVVAGLTVGSLSLEELAALGVKRVSVGSALARAALGAFLRGAREIRERGTFSFAKDAVSYAEMNAMLKSWPSD